MTDPQRVIDALGRWPTPRAMGREIVVPTQCLYPSNGIVMLSVEGGVDLFRVHDRRGAIDEFMSAGGPAVPNNRGFEFIARRQGLRVDQSGKVIAPLVPLERLPGAVGVVANVSKEVAHHLVDRLRPHPRRSLHDILQEILDFQFPTETRREEVISGHSNKPHKFDFVVRLPEERKLVIDAVSPEPSSVNAAVVAHLDVAAAKIPGLLQRIVYDDEMPWKAADLNLLTVGARAIPLSSFSNVLRGLGNAA